MPHDTCRSSLSSYDPPALEFGELGAVVTGEELSLEELYADDGKHELQQARHQHDVPDGLDGHDHALHHVLREMTAQIPCQTKPTHVLLGGSRRRILTARANVN